jgi:hypothetical protein
VPFPAETAASYVRRLALANQLDPDALRRYVNNGRGRGGPYDAGMLAVVSGQPEHVLRCAIPDLVLIRGNRGQAPVGYAQWRADDGTACRLCAAARGITEPVRCWKQPEQVICLRHRRWIGAWTGDGQPDLSGQPAILQAYRRHLRLVRRLGRGTVAVGCAYADRICRQWHDQRQHDEGFRQRMLAFGGRDWAAHRTDPSIAAAAYPQVVALARLLASPYWRPMALSGSQAGRQAFAREVQRTVAPGWRWPSATSDPLYRWATGRWDANPRADMVNHRRFPDPPWRHDTTRPGCRAAGDSGQKPD